MNKGCDNLLFLVSFLSSNKPLPTDLEKWYINCLERWQWGESLNDAFGISDNAAERRHRRNIELKTFAGTLHDSQWANVGFIADEVSKVRQGRRQCNEIIKSIDAIYRIPESPRHIYRIIYKSKD